MVQVGKHHQQKDQVPRSGDQRVALPRSAGVRGHDLVDHRHAEVHGDVHQHVTEIKRQVLDEERVVRKAGGQLLDGHKRQNHHRSDQSRENADEADRGNNDDRRNLRRTRAAQVLPPERIGQPIAARDRPKQIAGP